jgi:integrase
MRDVANFRKVQHPRYKFVASFQERDSAGRAIRRKAYFATKGAASAFVARKKTEISNHGARHGSVADDERAAVIRFRTWAEAKENPPSLLDLINDAIEAFDRVRRSCTVSELVASRLEQVQRARKAERYQQDLAHRLNRFAAAFGERQVASLKARELEAWLCGLKLAPISVANFKRALSGAFTLAVRNEIIEANPLTHVETPKIVHKAPAILSPKQVQSLLDASPPDLLPLLVLQAFAGLRRAEAERLAWERIHLDGRQPFVELPSEVTKTNRRRLIELQPNAVAWLAQAAGEGVSRLGIGPRAYRKHLTQAAKTAKIGWEENLLRHSFGSYRLAVLKNAAQVAEEMGNSANVVRTHYMNLVRPESVAAYWNVKPTVRRGGTVIPFHGERRVAGA